MAKQRT
jgi:hypothetical protein